MASSLGEVNALISKAAAHKTALEALTARKTAIEKQQAQLAKGVAKVLKELLSLVNDETRFGNDIVRLCSGWKWESTTQAWIPDSTGKRLRRWHRRFTSKVELLQEMIKAQVDAAKVVKDHSRDLFRDMTALHIQHILPVQQVAERVRLDCIAERETLPQKKMDLMRAEMTLKAEQAWLSREAEQLQREINALRASGDLSDAKGFALAGGGFGLAAMAIGSFIPPLGIMAGVAGIFFGAAGARATNRIERKVKDINRKADMLNLQASTFLSNKESLERHELALRERELLLPALESATRSLAAAFDYIKPAAAKLERGCLEQHSAMTVMLPRVTTIMSSTSTLKLLAPHENLIDRVSDIVAAFSRGGAGSAAPVSAVIARLAIALEKMKSNKEVVSVLRNLEDRDDYIETLEATDEEDRWWVILLTGFGVLSVVLGTAWVFLRNRTLIIPTDRGTFIHFLSGEKY